MPTVDVIIPAYNAERYLVAALESVMAQEFADWRILLVNDGSTDGTAAIAREYEQQLGEKMVVITQVNAGLPAARNAALRVGTSEFVAILDADDVWLPCRLHHSLKTFEGRPTVGLSYGLITRIDEHGAEIGTWEGNPAPVDGPLAARIYTRQVELPCPTITFRRQCVEEVGGFDETMRATEDRDLWLRIALRYRVAFVPKVIALYRTSMSSMSGDPERMLKAQLQFIRKHRRAPGISGSAYRIALSRAYKQRGEALLARSRRWDALLSSLRACVIWPFGVDNLRTAASLALSAARLRRA